jgi:hypothetical protein
MIHPHPDGSITPSCLYDDAVGDINAAIDKIDGIRAGIDELGTDDERSDDLEEMIDHLQAAVDFDHLTLDTPKPA